MASYLSPRLPTPKQLQVTYRQPEACPEARSPEDGFAHLGRHIEVSSATYEQNGEHEQQRGTLNHRQTRVLVILLAEIGNSDSRIVRHGPRAASVEIPSLLSNPM